MESATGFGIRTLKHSEDFGIAFPESNDWPSTEAGSGPMRALCLLEFSIGALSVDNQRALAHRTLATLSPGREA